MAQSQHEVQQYCKKVLTTDNCSFGSLKFDVMCHFGVKNLKESDLSFIKDVYTDHILKSWKIEAEKSIDDTVSKVKLNKREIATFNNKISVSKCFDNAWEFMVTPSYKIIKENRNFFNDSTLEALYEDLTLYVRLKIKAETDYGNEVAFIDALIVVIKNSDLQYETLIAELDLINFLNAVISLEKLMNIILEKNFEIKSFDSLRLITKSLIKNGQFDFTIMVRNEIKPYIIIERNTKRVNGRETLEIKRKIVFLHDIGVIPYGVIDVLVVCEIFHGAQSLKNYKSIYKYSLDNLMIVSSIFKVHDAIKINLSGSNGEPLALGKAKKNFFDSESNGKDGNAGESGGNFGLACEKIINGHLLMIISNGGNGSNGQDGGDGEDGKNGRDVQMSNLSWAGNKFTITNRSFVLGMMIFPISIGYTIAKGIATTSRKQGERDSYDGLYKVIAKYDNFWKEHGFILAQGEDGTPGTRGGLGGIGGEGGCAGIINILCNEGNTIIQQNKNGTNGKDGLGGLNGINGRDGRDAWAYDSQYWANPEYFGLGENTFNKYEVCTEQESSDYSVWNKHRNCYFVVRHKKNIRITTTQQRNVSNALRSRASHAQAKTKESSFRANIKEKFSQYYTCRENSSCFIDSNLNLKSCAKNITTISSKIKHQVSYSNFKGVTIYTPQFEKVSINLVKNKILAKNFNFSETLKLIRKSIFSVDELDEVYKIMKRVFNIYDEISLENFVHYPLYACLTNEESSHTPQNIVLFLRLKIFIEQNKVFKFSENSQSQTPKIISKLIPYLINTWKFKCPALKTNHDFDHFRIDFANFHFYFNEDSDLNRNQIISLFMELQKNFKENCQVSKKYEKLFLDIFKNLVKHRQEISELTEILNELNTKLLKLVQKKQENYTDFLKNVFGRKEIIKFIEKNMIEEGIRSPIYKMILTVLFEVSFRIFVISEIDGSLSLLEEYEGEFTKPQVINLLMQKKKFSILKFDEEKFQRDKQYEICGTEWFSSYFPKVFNKMNSDYLVEKIVANFSENDVKLLKVSLNEFKEKSLLYSIAMRLLLEECVITFSEFNAIISSILAVIPRNQNIVKYFSCKFLTLHHSKWIVEIILFTIENYLNQTLENRETWSEILCSVNHHAILILLLVRIEKLDFKEMNEKDFESVIKSMKYFSQENYSHLFNLKKLISWQNVITSEYWLQKYNFLTLKESAIINELQNKFGAPNLDQLLMIMNKKSSQFSNFNISEFLQNFNNGEWIFSTEQFEILTDNDPINWIEKMNEIYKCDSERSVEQICYHVDKNNETSQTIKERSIDIASFTKKLAINELLNRSSMRLRNTQIFSVITLMTSERGALIQVGTGEGKTFIGVGFAAHIAKNIGQKIHIVTSSSVLAERDAKNPAINYFFHTQGKKVGHNCYDDEDKRRQIYMECNIVYGTLGNFQRDYLLTSIFDKNILPEKYIQNVLVDEVDSILLDKGNNILYLSKELPDIDELNSAFIFIWQFINHTPTNEEDLEIILKPQVIREAFLDSFYGILIKIELETILHQSQVNVDTLGKKLIENEIINEEYCLIVDNFAKINASLDKICNDLNINKKTKSKLYYYIKRKIELPKSIKIPKYYHSFVLRYLDKWIKSALNAIIMQEGVQYVIDKTSDSCEDNDPNVIILDIDTGTDQKNSEWDEGLCQFIQLKHGCRLSQLSLKSVFVSNVTYLKKYKNIFGMTGTLGSKDEREKINNFYNLEYATIPSYLPKKFIELDAIVTSSNEEWMNEIIKETINMFKFNRSVLVICNTIEEINSIENSYRHDSFFKNEMIKTYKRDYEDFDIESLLPKQLIIATNLAGRGTDIKISNKLNESGGLHVILTYLPPNVRIENQAFGRAARAGAKGSARLIIMNDSKLKTIKELKQQRDLNELYRLEDVSNFYQKFITVEEGFFQKFLEAYKNYSENLKKNYQDKKLIEILLENFKVLWSLWLDEKSEYIKLWDNYQNDVKGSFDTFIEKTTRVNYLDANLHPIMRLKLSNHLQSLDESLSAKQIIHSCEELKGIIAYDYNQIFLNLCMRSREKKYKQFELDDDEIWNIKKVIKNFKEKLREKLHHSMTIRVLKQKYQTTLIPIEGFENQVTEFNELIKVFIKNLENLLGKGIAPNSFNCTPFGNDIHDEGFYRYLIGKYIDYPTVNKNFDESEINFIAKSFDVDEEKLLTLLKCTEIIKCFDAFAENLKNTLNFPSREFFWDCLVENEILTDVKTFAIIDIKTIKEFLPCEETKCIQKYSKHKVNILKQENKSEIFLYKIDDEKPNFDVMILELNNNLKSDEHFKSLVNAKVVKFNKKATFNAKLNLAFENFDSITAKDFEFIVNKGVKQEIIDQLVEQKILYEENSLYRLNYNNLFQIDLSENSIYQTDILKLLHSKFKYRIAFEKLKRDFNENKDDILIKLESKPEINLLHDLIANYVIKFSKVKKEQIKKFEDDEIFSEYFLETHLKDLLENKIYNYGFELPNNIDFKGLKDELLRRRILFQFNKETEDSDHLSFFDKCRQGVTGIISSWSNFYSLISGSEKICILNTEIKFKKYTNIEDSVKLILIRKKMLIANKDAIIKTIKDAIPSFESMDLDNFEPVMKPLEEFTEEKGESLHCMEYKGLDNVITVKRKLTWWYYAKLILWVSFYVLGCVMLILHPIVGIPLYLSKFATFIVLFDIIMELNHIFTAHKNGTFYAGDQFKREIIKLFTSHGIIQSAIFLTQTLLIDNYKRYRGTYIKRQIAHVEIKSQNKNMIEFKKRYDQITKSTKKIDSILTSTNEIERNVRSALDNLLSSLSNVAQDKICRLNLKEMFSSSKIVLAQKSEADKENQVNQFTVELLNENNYFDKLVLMMKAKVENLLDFDLKTFSTINHSILNDVLDGPTITLLNLTINTIIIDLNEKLKAHMTDNETEISEAENSKFFGKILENFGKHFLENLKTEFIKEVQSSALCIVSKKSVTYTSEILANQIKECASKSRNKNDARDPIMKYFNKLEYKDDSKMSVEDELVDISNKKLIKYKNFTLNPSTIVGLCKKGYIMTSVEVEAAARLCNRKFEIQCENICYNFGSKDCIELLKMNARDGLFTLSNGKNPTITYQNLYWILCEKSVLKTLSLNEFKQEICEKILNDSEIQEIIISLDKKHRISLGFYGIKGSLKLNTREGSLKFINLKEELKLKYLKFKTYKFTCIPNQDIRTFNTRSADSVSNHLKFNQCRNKAINLTLVKINETFEHLSIKLNKLQPVSIENFVISKAVQIMSLEGEIFMPVELMYENNNLKIILKLDLAIEDEIEIPQITAELNYSGLNKTITYQTLMPAMDTKKENDLIPTRLSPNVLEFSCFKMQDKFINPVKIFGDDFAHVKLITMAEEVNNENLPSVNHEYIDTKSILLTDKKEKENKWKFM